MVLLIASISCGLFSFICALILQYQLAGWLFLSGLHNMVIEKRANIDVSSLRRSLSILMYFLSLCFLSGSLFRYLKVIPESFIIPLYFIVILAVFDCVFFFWRKYDHNAYSQNALRSVRFFLAGVNLFFLFLCFVFLRG